MSVSYITREKTNFHKTLIDEIQNITKTECFFVIVL